jgi:hypothetical protein
MLVVLSFTGCRRIQGSFLLVNSLSSIRLISLSYVFHNRIPYGCDLLLCMFMSLVPPQHSKPFTIKSLRLLILSDREANVTLLSA